MDSSDSKQEIKNHLLSFGIQVFTSDASYWAWGGKKLGPKRAGRLDTLRLPLTEGATKEQLHQFYDYIAHPDVSGVVHSMKADAIAASGFAVDAALPKAGRILELGCSIGHLTTFYGRQSSLRDVVGCDFSERSIFRARKEAKKRKVDNVSFEVVDIDSGLPSGPFDAVVSTQVLSGLYNRREALGWIAKILAPNGIVVSIEPLGTAAEATAYLNDVAHSGLMLDSFQFVFFYDLGDKRCYPAFILKSGAKPLQIDLSQKYAEVLEKLTAAN